MNIKTKFLGEINIEENDIIHFKNGIPGLKSLKRYVMMPLEGNPMVSYLQSIEEENVCFIVMSPFIIKEDYDIEISEDTVKELDICNLEEITLYAVINIQGDIKDATVNLKAPIIINTRNKKAAQELLESDKYLIKHRLVKED